MTKSPVLFLSHGAPPLADHPVWTRELAQWGSSLPRPRQVLIVSAHWEDAPAALSSVSGAPLLHDFWGFPQRYYEVTYDAPPAPELADRVAALVGRPGRPVHRDEDRGLDHGAYVPLKEMFPAGDVPVLQLSMPTLDPTELYRLGQQLAPLRDEGTLIIGSGFTTHNLSAFRPGASPDAAPPGWSAEFDAWAVERMADGDTDALLDFLHRGPDAETAHPRTEHFAPLFVALGAAGGDPATSTVDGYWHGLSKRSWQLEVAA